MATKPASRGIKLFGTDVPDGKKRTLTAGPISAVLDNGALRYIRFNGAEVLRGIAFLVRDKNWGTYAPAITGLKVRQGKDSFTVSYEAVCQDADQGIRYAAKIEASAQGVVKFSAHATPLSDFLTNRTGFVVLHPLVGVVGEPVEIVHTNGKTKKSRFPKFISPGQPVFEIRSLKHTVTPGVTATVLMDGNKFEMEDHRNWMDASYKTYVCSLLDPWPYTLKKGEAFDQSITVTVAGKAGRKASRSAAGGVIVTNGKARGRIPAIGVGIPMAEAKAALDRAELVAAAGPSHLVCQIDGRKDGQAEAAAAFAALKSRTGKPVTLEIVLPARESADKEVAAIAAAVTQGGLKPDAVVVTQMHDLKSFQPNTPRPWGPTYEEMAEACRKHFPGVTLGGGMLSYFTELNRKPVPRGVFDFVTHTVCPIVHAADDISVMETLEVAPLDLRLDAQHDGQDALSPGSFRHSLPRQSLWRGSSRQFRKRAGLPGRYGPAPARPLCRGLESGARGSGGARRSRCHRSRRGHRAAGRHLPEGVLRAALVRRRQCRGLSGLSCAGGPCGHEWRQASRCGIQQ